MQKKEQTKCYEWASKIGINRANVGIAVVRYQWSWTERLTDQLNATHIEWYKCIIAHSWLNCMGTIIHIKQALMNMHACMHTHIHIHKDKCDQVKMLQKAIVKEWIHELQNWLLGIKHFRCALFSSVFTIKYSFFNSFFLKFIIPTDLP